MITPVHITTLGERSLIDTHHVAFIWFVLIRNGGSTWIALPCIVLYPLGGTNVKIDSRALNRPQGIDILVATPGRLLMHLEETAGFAGRVKGVKVLVFDEADRLLDMCFKR